MYNVYVSTVYMSLAILIWVTKLSGVYFQW